MMNITLAKYVKDKPNDTISVVTANINGEIVYVPMNPDNIDYAEIQRQVAAGELTIADAD
tara:strand:+ start:754 stop:933 length:180 start_codon:yes stop_codon:yes gene_type:complete